MPRPRSVSAGAGSGLSEVVRVHPMAVIDPVGARLVDGALKHYVVSTRSYDSAVRNYIRFCAVRSVLPWPVAAMWVYLWMHELKRTVKPSTIKTYLSGLRYSQVLMGFDWQLSNNELVRRTMRFIKREFPEAEKAAKVPVSFRLLRRMFVLIPGWPFMARMSPADRCFVVASLLAVSGFMRGGEFLTYPGSRRPMLSMGMVSLDTSVDGAVPDRVTVFIPQTKTVWWLESVAVPVFANTDDPCFCPVHRWQEILGLLPACHKANDQPAFRTTSGSALSKAWIVARTVELMELAQVRFTDATGKIVPVKAASWRAGGVRSALDAGLSEQMIMRLGRWRSIAWTNYMLQSLSDVQGAARSMWRVSHAVESGGALLVGEMRPASVFEEEDRRAEAIVRGRSVGGSRPQ